MREQIEKLRESAIKAVWKAKTLDDLRVAETHYLGRKGELTSLLRSLADFPEKDRPAAGEVANRAKIEVEREIGKKRAVLEAEEFQGLGENEWTDVTAPGARPPEGHLHLTTQAIGEVTGIFERLGFTRVRAPEVDWDYYAFQALNMPPDHPARDEWETFFMDLPAGRQGRQGRVVLTPHTSKRQVREMERGELPIRIVCISKCYRRQMDISHVPMFHQFEGLLIDKQVSVTHLKGVLDYFAREFFGPGRVTRLRPFHFRFTEPSFEVDISCAVCKGTGKSGALRCRLCKEGWLELGGAGMVHPNVLRAGGIDPQKYSGFAFGWGVERTAMMKSGVVVDDIRTLYKNDLRFLNQF